MYVDDQGNQVTNTYDVSTAQMNYYYFQLSQFNQDEAEYFGVVAPFWTSKGVQKQGEGWQHHRHHGRNQGIVQH